MLFTPNGCAEVFIGQRILYPTNILPEMLSEAVSFCKRNMKVRTIIDLQTGERKGKTEYPIEAICEAILNALIRRDYSHFKEGTPVQIE